MKQNIDLFILAQTVINDSDIDGVFGKGKGLG